MRRPVLVGAVAALVAVSVSGCHANNTSAGPAQTKAKTGGELDVLSSAPTINLDPAKSQNLATSTIHLVLRSLTTWRTWLPTPARSPMVASAGPTPSSPT
jgi:peptide/nickel transport system substrate-binding protein